VIILVVGAVAAVVVGRSDWLLGANIGFVVFHFFLFCNVFRISRTLELTWAAAFLCLAAGLFGEAISLVVAVSLSLLCTLIVIAIETTKPSYHGIWWRRINPGLPNWWEANQRPAPSSAI
jgi:hypothetical protein